MSLLYQGADWDFSTLRRSYDAIERIACEELGLEVYPNRIEVITSEQMLDVYTAHGMPLTYRHWSYGKRFLQHESSYRGGYSSLAYEVVINSNPLHQLLDGGEYGDDAGAGDRACGVRPQPLLPQQPPVPAVDGSVRDPRLPGVPRGATSVAARTAMAWRRWSACWTRPTPCRATACTGMAARGR